MYEKLVCGLFFMARKIYDRKKFINEHLWDAAQNVKAEVVFKNKFSLFFLMLSSMILARRFTSLFGMKINAERFSSCFGKISPTHNVADEIALSVEWRKVAHRELQITINNS